MYRFSLDQGYQDMYRDIRVHGEYIGISGYIGVYMYRSRCTLPVPSTACSPSSRTAPLSGTLARLMGTDVPKDVPTGKGYTSKDIPVHTLFTHSFGTFPETLD